MADMNGDSELETMDYCDGAVAVRMDAFPLHAVQRPGQDMTPRHSPHF